MKRILLTAFALSLLSASGCAYNTVLADDAGRTGRCHLFTAFGAFGVYDIVSYSIYRGCVSDYEKQGFVKLESAQKE